MYNFIEVLDIKRVSFDFDYCTLVFIDIAIVRSAKDCYDTRQLLRLFPVVDFVTLYLNLMSPNDKSEVVFVKELLSRCKTILE